MTIIRTIITFYLFLIGQSFAGESEMDFDARNWFSSYQSELEQVKLVLSEHPNIKRIDPALRLDFVPKNGEFSDADYQAYQELVKTCKRMGIENIVVYRDKKDAISTLTSINFTVASKGLLTKGSSVSVEFLKDLSFAENAAEYGLRYQPLELENWFVVYREQK